MWPAATWHQLLGRKMRRLPGLSLMRCCLPQRRGFQLLSLLALLGGVTLRPDLIAAAGDALDLVVDDLFKTAVSAGLGQADALTQKRLADALEIIAGTYIGWPQLCLSIGKACSQAVCIKH